MIMGHARHGKDTVCEILRDTYGFTFESSSMAAARYAIYPVLQDLRWEVAGLVKILRDWRG
jgi:hypothetical protein